MWASFRYIERKTNPIFILEGLALPQIILSLKLCIIWLRCLLDLPFLFIPDFHKLLETVFILLPLSISIVNKLFELKSTA